MPVEPIEPDPGFAAALRARLQRVLLAPRGGTTMTTAATAPADTAARPGELPLRSLTPYLAVQDGRRALDFYAAAFGARRRGEPIVMEDGRIGHAELAIGDSVLMLADEFAEIGLLSPASRGGPSQSLLLQVDDPDAAVARAVAAGARLTRPVADSPHGRGGVVADPFGHRWMVYASAARAVPPHGGVGYASLWVPDADKAAIFFSAVLGWTYEGGDRQHRMVAAASPRHGIVALAALSAGVWDRWPRHATLFTSHAVPDVDAAIERIRAAGGRVGEPTEEPYGRAANCVDDQGMPFAVYQDTGSARQDTGSARQDTGSARQDTGSAHQDTGSARQDMGSAPGTAASPGHGQVAYLTFEVGDSARARAFYGAVFGWGFTAGHVADGWQIEGITPMGGLHGGHDQATVVPMYAVDDIEGAVIRVRQAGGSATGPEPQPYGVTASCADDQGTRFYLGQLG
jgi:predicted enzyme related to lactoylglutathione lyase